MDPPPRPPSHRALDRLIARWKNKDEAAGESLMVLGSGTLGMTGATGAAAGLDADGDLVLVVELGDVRPETGGELADELDRLAAAGEEALAEVTTERDPSTLSADHARRFLHRRERSLNQRQRVVLVTHRPVDERSWKQLVVELGAQLTAVFVVDGDELRPHEVPAALVRSSSPRRGLAGTSWPLAQWIGLVVVLFGVGLAVAAVYRGLSDDGSAPGVSTGALGSPLRDVAPANSADVTHNQWIGQQHLLRTSRGRLLALFRSDEGLQIAADQADQGRVWRAPVTLPAIEADSFSAALDGDDDIHLVFVNASGASYVELVETRSGWKPGGILRLDSSVRSPGVDIAWDEPAGVAHIGWVGESESGQQPMWAAVEIDEGNPEVMQQEALTEPGTDIPVLLTMDVSDSSIVLATYRDPGDPVGWFSRSADREADGTFIWQPAERLPTGGGIGAASAAFDRYGVAHLILRDSTNTELSYFRHSGLSGWSSPKTAVDAESIDEIDFPSVAVDSTSRLVYVFFQTNRSSVPSEVRVAVFDPAAGWEEPYRIVAPADVSEGAAFPNALAEVQGQPIVLWTKQGPAPTVQVARVIAP